MTELTQAADDYFGAGEQFQQAEEQFKAISGDPGHALDHAMAGVLRTLAAVAQAALAGVDHVMTALTEALAAAIETVQVLLNTPLPIPLLADLYGHYAGKPLTFLGLFALVLAVPANVIYMLLFDQAPFPDQQALDRFQALATADALWQRTGLGSGAPGPAADGASALAGNADDWVRAQRAFSVLSVINNFVWIGIDTFIDVILPEKPSAGGDAEPKEGLAAWGTALSVAALASSSAAAFFGCPWWYAPGAPGAQDADQFGRVLWITQLVPIAVNLGWAAAGVIRQVPRSSPASVTPPARSSPRYSARSTSR